MKAPRFRDPIASPRTAPPAALPAVPPAAPPAVPPPVSRGRDALPWVVSLLPIAAIALDPYLGQAAPWVILGGSALLSVWDRARLRASGLTDFPLWSAVFFPAHLLRRSRAVGRNIPFALLWLVAMLLHSKF